MKVPTKVFSWQNKKRVQHDAIGPDADSHRAVPRLGRLKGDSELGRFRYNTEPGTLAFGVPLYHRLVKFEVKLGEHLATLPQITFFFKIFLELLSRDLSSRRLHILEVALLDPIPIPLKKPSSPARRKMILHKILERRLRLLLDTLNLFEKELSCLKER
jgi:hypothetical protein